MGSSGTGASARLPHSAHGQRHSHRADPGARRSQGTCPGLRGRSGSVGPARGVSPGLGGDKPVSRGICHRQTPCLATRGGSSIPGCIHRDVGILLRSPPTPGLRTGGILFDINWSKVGKNQELTQAGQAHPRSSQDPKARASCVLPHPFRGAPTPREEQKHQHSSRKGFRASTQFPGHLNIGK